jgi:RTX calcium-binding nonapeptide repeat (4 copies)
MGGYAVDGANGKSAIDGFNVVWTSTDTIVDSVSHLNSQGLTQAQIDAGYGQIMLQRFAVPLDSRVDPIGPPVAAGLDGIATTDAANGLTNTDANAPVQIAAVGRDPSTIVTHDGEMVITWIDTANQVHVRAFDLGGTEITGNITGVAVNDIDGAGVGVVGGLKAKVVDLAGAGFVVAWVGDDLLTIPGQDPIPVREVKAVVFTPGAALGTYTAAQPTVLDFLPAAFADDFSLGTLVDSGGFSLSYTVGSDVFVHAFDSNGASLGAATSLPLPADQTASQLAGLIGDRIVTVYQDNQAANPDVGAAIFDTRTLADGSPITSGGLGLTLTGDDVDIGRPRARADVLVGTIGNDTLSGLLADDELHGALGDDRLIGGVGDDILDGGGGTDTAVFSGNSADYIISYLGGDLFTIEDAANPARDGIDTLRGIENFEFADTTKTALAIISGIEPVTPTAWGWSNEDPDVAPNIGGTPDVDGFLVNHAAAKTGAKDTNAFVADSVGEFIGVVWEHTALGASESHIQGQFYDVIGAFDEFLPNVVNLSDGLGIETNPVLVSGGANSGWGIAFEELDSGGNDVTHTIRTNFGVDPVGAQDTSFGRIMMQRFEVPLDALGNPGAPVGGGVDGIAGLDGLNVLAAHDGTDPRDAAFWVGAERGGTGVMGRNPSTTALYGFETIVTWIETDATGAEHVAGRAYDDLGQVINVPGLATFRRASMLRPAPPSKSSPPVR